MNNHKNSVFTKIIVGGLLFLFSYNLLAYSGSDDSILVDVIWLQNRQMDDNLVIVDARSREDYLFGHIAGAVNIPVADTFSPTNPTDRVANLQHIQHLFSAAGIHKNDTVVIYDDTSYIDAGRVFWVFEVFGHCSVKLLNGGYTLWKKNALPIEDSETVRAKSNYIPEVEPKRLVTRFSMRLAIEDDNKVIIDARPAEDYYGEHTIASRPGHIPGAINIPWKENFEVIDGVNMLKSEAKLREIYHDLGDKQIYTYCNKGKQSSLTYTLLRQLGKDVAHYDGSWSEWGNDPDLPTELSLR